MQSSLRDIQNGWLDPEATDPVMLFRQRAVLLITTLLGAATIPLVIHDLYGGFWVVAGIEIVAGLFALVVYALLYLTRRPGPGGNLTLSVIWLAATLISISGGLGLASTAVFYYLLLPIIGGLLIGLRGVLSWGGMGMLGIIALTAGHALGWLPTPLSTPDVSQHLLDATVLLSLCTGATAAFLSLQQQTLDRMQAEIQQRRQAEQTQARFLATMSHELRTPLNGVVGAATLMSSTPISADQHFLLTTITDSASTLLTLINSVLDYSRLEAGEMSIEELPVSLRALLQQTTTSIALLAEQKGLAFSVAVDDAVPAWILTDPTRLQQIIINLTGNAVKFTEAGSVRIHAGVEADMLAVRIADTGIGISEDDRRRLFQPFTQAEAGTSRRFGGTGLGLSIVSRLLEVMGGRLELESAPGAGSRFTVVLPLKAARPPAEAPPAPARAAEPLSILLVDDHPLNRLITRRMLVTEGHEVVEAENGQLSLQALQTGSFSVVLMDCQMPVMDGLTATRAIRALPDARSGVRIIGLSANAAPQDRQAALDAGMDDYLTKPVDRRKLQETLRQLAQ